MLDTYSKCSTEVNCYLLFLSPLVDCELLKIQTAQVFIHNPVSQGLTHITHWLMFPEQMNIMNCLEQKIHALFTMMTSMDNSASNNLQAGEQGLSCRLENTGSSPGSRRPGGSMNLDRKHMAPSHQLKAAVYQRGPRWDLRAGQAEAPFPQHCLEQQVSPLESA